MSRYPSRNYLFIQLALLNAKSRIATLATVFVSALAITLADTTGYTVLMRSFGNRDGVAFVAFVAFVDISYSALTPV